VGFFFVALHGREAVFDFGFMKNFQFFIKPKSKTLLVTPSVISLKKPHLLTDGAF
jgi:hypothetical protein